MHQSVDEKLFVKKMEKGDRYVNNHLIKELVALRLLDRLVRVSITRKQVDITMLDMGKEATSQINLDDLFNESLQCHRVGFIHCDIKRDNITFDGSKYRLIDFDIIAFQAAVKSRYVFAMNGCRSDTLNQWLAPEMFSNRMCFETSLWCFAMMIYPSNQMQTFWNYVFDGEIEYANKSKYWRNHIPEKQRNDTVTKWLNVVPEKRCDVIHNPRLSKELVLDPHDASHEKEMDGYIRSIYNHLLEIDNVKCFTQIVDLVYRYIQATKKKVNKEIIRIAMTIVFILIDNYAINNVDGEADRILLFLKDIQYDAYRVQFDAEIINRQNVDVDYEKVIKIMKPPYSQHSLYKIYFDVNRSASIVDA